MVFFRVAGRRRAFFFSVEFVRTAYRLDIFEFLTKFNSVNCVRLNSPISSCAVCLPVENCLLYVCYFSTPKNSEHFRIRNRCPTTVASTEFQAEHEYRNGLFKFVEMDILPVPFWVQKRDFLGFSTGEFFYRWKKRARLEPVTLKLYCNQKKISYEDLIREVVLTFRISSATRVCVLGNILSEYCGDFFFRHFTAMLKSNPFSFSTPEGKFL